MNNKGVLTIVILVLLVLGLGGYIAYDKVYLKIVEKDKKEISEIQDVRVDINELFSIDQILNDFDEATNNEQSNYFGALYKNNSLKVKEMDKTLALYLVLYNEINGTKTYNYLNGNKIKRKFTKVYGDYLDYTPTNLNITNNIQVTYQEQNTLYSYGYFNKKPSDTKSFFTKNISTSLKDDTVTVKRKVFYTEYQKQQAGDSILKVDIYKDMTKTKKIDTLELRDQYINVDEIIDRYGSRLNTYIYKFRINNDVNYNFYSIELEK